MSRQAGIGTYTSNVLKAPIIESMSKVLDAMIAYDLPDHVKGFPSPITSSLSPYLTNHSRRVSVFDAKLSVYSTT